MISSEVKRTLVKSPPELWAELSDQAALTRHLGELGEITIIRTEPEKLVEWEAANTTGKVLLKSSGWGTKVTLTADREFSITEPSAQPEAEPEPAIVEAEATVAVAPTAVAAEPIAALPEPAIVEPEPTLIEEPAPKSEILLEEPEPRPGFFARLFRRRPRQQAVLEPPVDLEAAVEPVAEADLEAAAEPVAAAEPELTPAEKSPPQDAPPEDLPDIAAELKAAEEAATEEVTAVLTAALDRLGAAHHRPFSRA
jgi:hypothetical protein